MSSPSAAQLLQSKHQRVHTGCLASQLAAQQGVVLRAMHHTRWLIFPPFPASLRCFSPSGGVVTYTSFAVDGHRTSFQARLVSVVCGGF